MNKRLERAWDEELYDKADELVRWGADPMSVERPVLTRAVWQHDFSRALRLARHRWREIDQARDWESEGKRWGGPDPSETLCRCICFGHITNAPELFELLLAQGCDPNAWWTPRGELMRFSALRTAVMWRNERAVKALLKAGARVDYLPDSEPNEISLGGDRLLHLAVRLGSALMAELLLAGGCDPRALNGDGVTARESIEAYVWEGQAEGQDVAAELKAAFARFEAREIAQATGRGATSAQRKGL